ncbi:hypothetical protein WG906_00785 [Pedobacter sp. P351]|uniref:hypothetical protein n=1 Tax=Pedobacter superstes TaxID=3133441 RepID=UPI00309D3137
MKQLFLISHDTTTAVQIGRSNTGIPSVEPARLAAINAFLTLNLQKNIIAVWDDDDIFEEILDTYTFITIEDANNSIYSKESLQ